MPPLAAVVNNTNGGRFELSRIRGVINLNPPGDIFDPDNGMLPVGSMLRESTSKTIAHDSEALRKFQRLAKRLLHRLATSGLGLRRNDFSIRMRESTSDRVGLVSLQTDDWYTDSLHPYRVLPEAASTRCRWSMFEARSQEGAPESSGALPIQRLEGNA
jgi:hypothetical protein